MNVSEAIRELLLSMSPITAVVQERIFVLRFPQSVRLPALRIQRVDAVEEMHLRGPGTMHRARVQVDSVALSGVQAEILDELVTGDGITSGLRAWHGFIGGSPVFQIALIRPITVRQDYDALELNQYKIMRDFFVWYRE